MVQSKKLSSATVAVQAELSTDVSELVSRLQARSLNPACDTVLVIRICLRNKLRTMLLTDIQLAATKNVDRVMWNYCFYDQIQFFRNQIRCLSKTGESYGKSDNLEPKIVGGENSSPQYQPTFANTRRLLYYRGRSKCVAANHVDQLSTLHWTGRNQLRNSRQSFGNHGQVMQPVKLLCGWLETSTWCWCKNPDTTQRAPFEIRNHRVWTVFPRVLNHLLHAMDASDVLSTHKPVQSIIFTTAKPGQDECTESCQRLLQCSQLCPLSEDRVVRGFAPFDMSASCLRRGNTVSNSMCSDQLQEKSSSGLAVSVRNTCIVRFGAWLTTHLGGEDGSDHLLYLQRVHPDPRPRQVPNTQPLVALPRSMSSAQPCDNMSSTLSDPQPPARGDPLWAGAILAAHDHHDYSESITLDDTAFGSMEISSPLLSTDDRDVDHAHNAADRMHSTMDHSIVRRIEQEHSGDVTTTALITASASTAWDTNHIQSTEDLFGWDANSGQRATSAAASWETFPKMDPRIGFPKTTTHAHFFGIHQLQSPEGLSATSSTAGSSDAASADGVPMSDTSPTGNTKTSSIITDTLPDTTLPAAGTTASHENITATNPSVPSSRASGIPTTHEWSTGALRSADQHTSVPSVRDPALLTPDQLLPLLK
eukprot:m.635850 g.635850  ORF g.635850 m.635850 type:complete len:648 (-) comp22587_c0_seq19:2462-4405(-)